MTSPTSVQWKGDNHSRATLTVQSEDWKLEFNIGGSPTFECRRVAAMLQNQALDTPLPYWELTELAKTLLKQLANDIVPPFIPMWKKALQQAGPPEQTKRQEPQYR